MTDLLPQLATGKNGARSTHKLFVNNECRANWQLTREMTRPALISCTCKAKVKRSSYLCENATAQMGSRNYGSFFILSFAFLSDALKWGTKKITERRKKKKDRVYVRKCVTSCFVPINSTSFSFSPASFFSFSQLFVFYDSFIQVAVAGQVKKKKNEKRNVRL